jgi:hypothetical protein
MEPPYPPDHMELSLGGYPVVGCPVSACIPLGVSSGRLPTRPTRPGLGAPKARGSPWLGALKLGVPRFVDSVALKGWCPQSLEIPMGRGPKDWRPPWVWGPHGLRAAKGFRARL